MAGRLSEEAQDIICLYITQLPNNKRSFLSLCLVSKSWLNTARRHLYRSLPRQSRWTAAISLLTTLQTCPGIARHVRDLSALRLSSLALANSPSDGVDFTSFSIRRQPHQWAYAVALLEACPLIQIMSVGATAEQLNKLRKPIRHATCLRELTINLSGPSPSLPAFHTWVKSLGLRLDKFTLSVETLPDAILSSSIPLVEPVCNDGLLIKSLQLLNISVPLPALLAFVPFVPSYITTLVISFVYRVNLPLADVCAAITLLSLHLQNLKVACRSFEVHGFYPAFSQNDDRLLPLHLFSQLPELREIHLDGFRFTMNRLEELRKHSSDLEVINIAGSYWSADKNNGTKSFSQTRVTSIFSDGLPTLRSVHLGWVPLRSPKVYGSLRDRMKEKGVELGYETTPRLTLCSACGDYH